jgi:hypothetical protein
MVASKTLFHSDPERSEGGGICSSAEIVKTDSSRPKTGASE